MPCVHSDMQVSATSSMIRWRGVGELAIEGCIVAQLHRAIEGCMAARLHGAIEGCMAARLHGAIEGCMAAWLHGALKGVCRQVRKGPLHRAQVHAPGTHAAMQPSMAVLMLSAAAVRPAVCMVHASECHLADQQFTQICGTWTHWLVWGREDDKHVESNAELAQVQRQQDRDERHSGTCGCVNMGRTRQATLSWQ
eukprot:365203-Chlamydomonas_euryale.AAC.21